MGNLGDDLLAAQRALLQKRCVFCTSSDDDGRTMLMNTRTGVSVCEHCVRSLHLRLMHYELLKAMPDGMTPQ